MDLSIIVPCHNLEDWISPLLKSIVAQTNNLGIEREIIFVCDKCTDKTYRVISNKMRRSKWKYTIIRVNEGCPGGARNRGLELATGKYIWFIDGDDWLVRNDAIDTFYNAIATSDCNIMECMIQSRKHPEGKFGSGTCWRFIYTRDIIGDTRFDNTQNGQDSRFNHVVLNKPEAKRGKVEEVIYFYNTPREGSQMWKKFRGGFDNE